VSTTTRWFSEFSVGAAEEILSFQFPTRDIDPAGGVDRHSGVFASVTTLEGSQSNLADYPAIGDASVTVRNIAAADDGTVRLWLAISPTPPAPLPVRLQFLVSND
jgi:hypothetical protein